MALVSVPLWVIFEQYNKHTLSNWHYVGLPETLLVRYFGYVWAFATIWPAILITAELVGAIRDRRAPAYRRARSRARSRSTRSGWTQHGRGRADAARCRSSTRRRGWRRRSGSASSSCSIRSTRSNGAESLRGDLRARHPWRLVNLLIAGLVCGLLWEFWNYWAHTKWVYTVPVPPDIKLFEMPLAGYLGFPAFAVECFVMYVFTRQCVMAWLVAADRTIIGRSWAPPRRSSARSS